MERRATRIYGSRFGDASGPKAVGSFVHTLVLTDVASGWTECIALPVREQVLIVEAIKAVRVRLPFPLLGLDTDNDSAFMNDTVTAVRRSSKRTGPKRKRDLLQIAGSEDQPVYCKVNER